MEATPNPLVKDCSFWLKTNLLLFVPPKYHADVVQLLNQELVRILQEKTTVEISVHYHLQKRVYAFLFKDN